MISTQRILITSLLLLTIKSLGAQVDSTEQYRPQIHFSPKQKWMNDPNGMVYYKGVYHLFYQFYPEASVWGPMHWAHATSKDLIHWQHQPVGLYPDSLGYIFSGSVVADVNNTSGLGTKSKPPLIAIFTHHNVKQEKEGRTDFQNQSIAFSIDDGMTWTKYAGNPVVKNPGIRDFRDPKVMWFEAGKKWIMTLATLDRITFYSSKDLKNWTKESEFGKELGAHGGVWECPDLFPLEHNGKTIWILLVSINPGGPNGGSATQYFTGDFDGNTFTPFDTDTKWIDFGTDNYAGITWSNTGKRKIFLGWMSNWQYADKVPTEKWRGATTIPRGLELVKLGERYFVASSPVKELSTIEVKPVFREEVTSTEFDLATKLGKLSGPARISFSVNKAESFTLVLSNEAGEKLLVGYDKSINSYFIDRSEAGKIHFEKGFGRRQKAPRIIGSNEIEMTLVVDKASVELFADKGISVMTAIFFPNKPFNHVKIQTTNGALLKRIEYTPLRSILE